jgi:hypothetical protein
MIPSSVGMPSLADRCFHDTPASEPGPLRATTVPVRYVYPPAAGSTDAVLPQRGHPKRLGGCRSVRRTPDTPLGQSILGRTPWLPSTGQRGRVQERTCREASPDNGLGGTIPVSAPTRGSGTSAHSVNAQGRVPHMPSSEARQVTAVRLNPADVDWLDAEALKADCTRSDIIRAAIAHYVEKALGTDDSGT